ncbi:MAG: hypothetical protein Q7S27_04260 [Nanoarchaeota archaeon]|nr:hypothetical protein [Nanoarchaeota archaeon]
MDERKIEAILKSYIEGYNSLGFSGVYGLRDRMERNGDNEERVLGHLITGILEKNLGGKTSVGRLYNIDEEACRNILNEIRNYTIVDKRESENA